MIYVNSLRPSDANMRQESRPSLVQAGVEPLSDTMIGYHESGHLGTIRNDISIEINTFHSGKCIGKYRLQNGGHFVLTSLC